MLISDLPLNHDGVKTKESSQRVYDQYTADHVETGQCLRALLSNDLFDFVGRADPETLGAAVALVKLVYNHMPSSCHGSRAKVEAWLALRVVAIVEKSCGRLDTVGGDGTHKCGQVVPCSYHGTEFAEKQAQG